MEQESNEQEPNEATEIVGGKVEMNQPMVKL